jgi:hypothetical protein
MTGADESIRPEDLIPISEKYPFVEWGILRSRSQNGSKRFPSQLRLADLAAVSSSHPLHLSAHLCGTYVREVLEEGDFRWLDAVAERSEIFERIQLNFHAERHTPYHGFPYILERDEDHEYIFQMDGTQANEQLYHDSRRINASVFPLFDVSGGIGAVPDQWPVPFDGVYCGYAGGLGPHSIVEQLQKIEQVAGDREIWIDMETHIRSDFDALFDLQKVERCIELALPWTTDARMSDIATP